MDARLQRLRSDIERNRAYKFWGDLSSWPFDAPEYVFIPRALDMLGRSLFANEWPPEILSIRKSPQFGDVILSLREHCAFGRLVAAIQRYDGTFEPIPAEIWNTRDYEQWFATDFKAPSTATGKHGHSSAAVPDCWLFVERAGFSALTVTVNHPVEGSETYQSSYMQLMCDAVRDLGISLDNQSKVEEVIKPYLLEQWKLRGLPESKKAREVMATMLRNPESQKGRALKKG
ncbi:hypothetical protein [Mesorhizobium sp. A556]